MGHCLFRFAVVAVTKLNEVFGFGISNPIHTYLDRSGLDEQFEHALQSSRHVVIYGPSKQGKSHFFDEMNTAGRM
jgi:hypothetical protein